jgi:hypothetical protein
MSHDEVEAVRQGSEHTVALLFADIRGYSQLDAAQPAALHHVWLPEIWNETCEKTFVRPELIVWDDSIICMHSNTMQLVDFALELVHRFDDYFRENATLPPLRLRAAIEMRWRLVSPAADGDGRGAELWLRSKGNGIRPPRLQPIIPPGQVWCIAEVKSACSVRTPKMDVVFDDMSEALTSTRGGLPNYRIRRSGSLVERGINELPPSALNLESYASELIDQGELEHAERLLDAYVAYWHLADRGADEVRVAIFSLLAKVMFAKVAQNAHEPLSRSAMDRLDIWVRPIKSIIAKRRRDQTLRGMVKWREVLFSLGEVCWRLGMSKAHSHPDDAFRAFQEAWRLCREAAFGYDATDFPVLVAPNRVDLFSRAAVRAATAAMCMSNYDSQAGADWRVIAKLVGPWLAEQRSLEKQSAESRPLTADECLALVEAHVLLGEGKEAREVLRSAQISIPQKTSTEFDLRALFDVIREKQPEVAAAIQVVLNPSTLPPPQGAPLALGRRPDLRVSRAANAARAPHKSVWKRADARVKVAIITGIFALGAALAKGCPHTGRLGTQEKPRMDAKSVCSSDATEQENAERNRR